MRYAPGCAAVGLMILALAGCNPSTKPRLDATHVKRLAAMTYPADAERGEDLDIVVVHRGKTIELVNRTARAYDGVTLWLNQQYVRPVERIAIGTGNTVDLRTAVNEHGRSYPVGSFLKPERRMRLVQAEMVDPATGLRHRLTVRPAPDASQR